MSGFKGFINKTVSDAKTTFNRAQQKTSEVLGMSDKTEYDPQFEQLYRRTELHKLWLQKIVSAVYEIQVPNPALRTMNFFADAFDMQKSNDTLYANVAAVFSQAASDIGDETSFGYALQQCGEVFKHANTFGVQFIQDTNNCFIIPITNFIREEIEPALRSKKNLDLLRLDLDAAKNRLNKCHHDKAAELITSVQQLSSDYDNQLNKTRSMFEQINSEKSSHIRYLHDLIDETIKYHNQMLTAFQTLKESMKSGPEGNYQIN